MTSWRSLPRRHDRASGPRPSRVLGALTLALAIVPGPARAADEPAPTAATTSVSRRPFPARDEVGAGTRRGAGRDANASNTGSWWLGTAGIAAALAACGWLSLASRRWKPAGVAGAAGLRVVGRTSLSPRHAVYLLQAGDRVLLVGTGPQGAPSLLGEMPAAAATPAAEPAASRRFDLHLGDDA